MIVKMIGPYRIPKHHKISSMGLCKLDELGVSQRQKTGM